MTSQARIDLTAQLADFDEVMEARDEICPSGAGRPARRRGAACIRGAVLLLAAAFEAYVEDVFNLAVDLLLSDHPHDQRKQLKKNTSGRLNNAEPFKVNMMFFHIGVPWIMGHTKLRWQKFNNDSVQSTLKELVLARNTIAHGKPKIVRKPTAVKWRSFVDRLADKIDEVVADRVEKATGIRPW